MSHIPTADIVDRYKSSGRLQVCETVFGSYGARCAFAGPITTVKCHQDNGLLKEIIARPGNGGVVVVDGGGSLGCALCGDRVAATAAGNGWSGLIIAGAVRDVETLRTIDIGILALGSNPWVPEKTGAGSSNVVLRFGNAAFMPAGWVYVDADGIVVADGPLDLD